MTAQDESYRKSEYNGFIFVITSENPISQDKVILIMIKIVSNSRTKANAPKILGKKQFLLGFLAICTLKF